MASYPILTRETESRDKSDVHEPAVLAYRRGPLLEPASEPYRAPKSIAEVGGLDEIPLPAVVLQLPDLKSTSYLRRGGRIPLASHAYWAALVFGRLFALWLVLSGRKPVERPTEEAPTWTGQASPPADRAISSWVRTANSAAAKAVATIEAGATTSEQRRRRQPDELHEMLRKPPRRLCRRSRRRRRWPMARLRRSNSRNAIRTARGGETHWDGTSNRIQPSEAAPLGITTPVPQ